MGDSTKEKVKQDFFTFEFDTDKYILFGMRFFTNNDNNNSQKWNDELKNEFKG